MISGARCSASSHGLSAPAGEVAAQNRERSAGVSSTRNAQPWVKPADGARSALASSRSRTAAGTGRAGS